MGFAKYASMQVLEIERETAVSIGARTAAAAHGQQVPVQSFETLQTDAGRRQAHRHAFEYTRRPGYIYVRSRAISSRTNDNYDDFPAEEIEKAWHTFIGKPVFVNHHNDDHTRARGVIIDAALHKDANPDGSPDTWVEVLMEVDARRFPLLAEAVARGDIARTSMGTNVEYSICTACGNKAYTPVEYCQHIPRMKGMKIRRANAATGAQEEVLIAERCYGLGFFENSLLVEDPADPTAFVLGVDGEGIQAAASRVEANFYRGTDGEMYEHQQVRHPHIPNGTSEDIPAGSSVTPLHNEHDPGFGQGSSGRMQQSQDAADRAVERQHRQLWRQHHPGVPYNPSYTPTASAEGHVHRHRHLHTCRFPVWGAFGVSSCGLPLDRDDACPQHGQQGAGNLSPQMAPVAAAGSQYERHVVKAEETRVGDRLDIGGKTRISKTHDFNGHRHVQTKTTGARSPSGARWEHGTDVTVFRPKTASLAKAAEMGTTAATNKAVCDDCQTPYNYSRISGTATFHIPSNGQRGQGHQPAHDVEVEGFTDDEVLWHFECPVCGYDNSQYTDADTYRELLGSRTAVGPNFWNDGAQIVWQQDHKAGEHEGHPQIGCRLCYPLSDSQKAQIERIMDGLAEVRTNEPGLYDRGLHGSRRTAQGEVKAPAQVDTMRAERCPVCQDDEAYDGDRCGICGYVAPPEMFQDPDLEKAREVDLRQDALETPDGEGGLEVATDDLDGQTAVLTCDACGEEFGPDAEADGTDGDDSALPEPTPEADPDGAADPTDAHGPQTPDDLSDLADKTDSELGLEDEDENHPEQSDAAQDPIQAQSPVEQDEPTDNADDTSSLSPADQAAETPVAKGDVCPVCGSGTIVSIQPEAPAEGLNPKEKSRDMNDHPKDQRPPVNPAKAARNRLVQALLGQQREIETLKVRNASLTDLVLEIGKAAGLGAHPKFAALQKSADDTNQTPETAPATTSQEARQPDATDDPQNVGATPEGANVNVTPQAVTDVASTDKVEPGQPPLSNLVDVTAPPPAGAAAAPAAGPGDKVINPVTVGTPSQTTMDPAGSTGWTASLGDPMERHTASLRLARLRIAAGLARGEDLSIGEEISKDASLSLETIKALSAELSQTLSTRQEQMPTRRQAQTIVPRAAHQGGGRAPSLAGGEVPGLDATAGLSTEGSLDEWGDFGMGDLTGG